MRCRLPTRTSGEITRRRSRPTTARSASLDSCWAAQHRLNWNDSFTLWMQPREATVITGRGQRPSLRKTVDVDLTHVMQQETVRTGAKFRQKSSIPSSGSLYSSHDLRDSQEMAMERACALPMPRWALAYLPCSALAASQSFWVISLKPLPLQEF